MPARSSGTKQSPEEKLVLIPRAVLWLAMAAALPSPALADPDKDESGKGRERRSEQKEEYWDGRCKVEKKWEKNGEYKEERKCEGGHHRESRDRDRRDRDSRRDPHEHRDDHRAEPRRDQGVEIAPTVVYPPWFEQQQGRYAYRPQYRPAPPPQVASRCNSSEVGKVLGGVLGAVLGNQIGSGSGRAVATIGGAVGGVLIGGEIGRRMDASDQGCIGQVLEVAPVGRRVEWRDGQGHYAVTPLGVVGSGGRYCRPYTVEMQTSRGWERSQGTACRDTSGVWRPS
jgi:surface antigen